jgi:hypothetical protein
MQQIHCSRCGGFIGNLAAVTYQEASQAMAPVVPHSGLCLCAESVVYGPAPEFQSDPQVYRIRSASRN